MPYNSSGGYDYSGGIRKRPIATQPPVRGGYGPRSLPPSYGTDLSYGGRSLPQRLPADRMPFDRTLAQPLSAGFGSPGSSGFAPPTIPEPPRFTTTPPTTIGSSIGPFNSPLGTDPSMAYGGVGRAPLGYGDQSGVGSLGPPSLGYPGQNPTGMDLDPYDGSSPTDALGMLADYYRQLNQPRPLRPPVQPPQELKWVKRR